jgi:glycosyltransferase involved in cell wall biosynthesis
MSRIALLSPVSRKETLAKIKTGEGTDNVLFGLERIPGVEFISAGESAPLLPKLLRYDWIVAQDNMLIGYIVSLIGRKTRWLYVAIHSSTLMRRHAKHPVRRFFLKRFWRSYARIVCISSEQMNDFVRFGIPREKLIFSPYGVDADFFDKASSADGEIIVSVGRDAGRDYPTLFKAAAGLKYQYTVVASQKNIPPDTQIPTNVSVFYNRSMVEVRDLLASARLVVVVSKNIDIPDGSDCSGQTVILEALAAGKAVIATYRPWIADYLVDGEDLLVVPPNDPGAIQGAIERLWVDSEIRKRLAESGHQKVLAGYTTKAFSDALLKLMHSL